MSAVARSHRSSSTAAKAPALAAIVRAPGQRGVGFLATTTLFSCSCMFPPFKQRNGVGVRTSAFSWARGRRRRYSDLARLPDQDEWCPEVRTVEPAFPDHLQLGKAQRLSLVAAPAQVLVETDHEVGRRSVRHLPEAHGNA